MKRILTLGVVVIAASMTIGTAHARNNNNVGCGWGTLMFKGQTGVAPQVLAITTNGTLMNNLFGISFGTAGCTKNGVIDPPQAASAYTGSNLDKLASDASRGGGENLETLAELIGVEQQDKAAFFQVAQQNFSTIFATENATAGQVLASLYGVMAEDEALNRYVTV
jgi:hypothetical protein